VEVKNEMIVNDKSKFTVLDPETTEILLLNKDIGINNDVQRKNFYRIFNKAHF